MVGGSPILDPGGDILQASPWSGEGLLHVETVGLLTPEGDSGSNFLRVPSSELCLAYILY